MDGRRRRLFGVGGRAGLNWVVGIFFQQKGRDTVDSMITVAVGAFGIYFARFLIIFSQVRAGIYNGVVIRSKGLLCHALV